MEVSFRGLNLLSRKIFLEDAIEIFFPLRTVFSSVVLTKDLSGGFRLQKHHGAPETEKTDFTPPAENPALLVEWCVSSSSADPKTRRSIVAACISNSYSGPTLLMFWSFPRWLFRRSGGRFVSTAAPFHRRGLLPTRTTRVRAQGRAPDTGGDG